MSWKKMISIIAAALLLSGPASACTLFSANGADYVSGGGTLIVKNRDWKPEWQEMRLIDKGTYRYYGLFAGDANKMGLRAGVNEKGLVVITATASSIPKATRLQMGHAKHSVLKVMLSQCATVDEALAHTELFEGPKFLMIGDAHQIAYIEIGDNGSYQIKKTSDGYLTHTNHYVEPSLQGTNIRIGPSSQARYNRINELLHMKSSPYTLTDFIAFSQDQHDGLDNSIWRRGSLPDKTQTLATFAVYVKDGQAPQIYVKLRHAPDEQDKEEVLTLTGADLFPPKEALPAPSLLEELMGTIRNWWQAFWSK